MDVLVFGAPALLWAVIMGLCWAVFDAARKGLTHTIPVVPLVTWLALGHLPLFGAWAGHELSQRPAGAPFPLAVGYVPPGLALLAANILANLCFLQAVRVSPLSITIPILSFTPAFVALMAWPILGQVPTIWQTGGIALVILGTVLLNMRRGDVRRPWQLLTALGRERGSLWMLAAAFGWSVTMVLDVVCLRYTTISLHVLLQLGVVGVVLLAVLLLRGQVRQLAVAARRPRLLVVGIAAASAALGLQLVLIADVPVGLLEALKRAIGMTAAVISGAWFFGERVGPAKGLAVALMSCGVYLIVV